MNLKSPFRYPGGKVKISGLIVSAIKDQVGFNSIFSQTSMNRFVDVFVGGGSVTMAVANEYPNVNLSLNDLDDWIFSFWKSIIDPQEFQRLLSYVNKYEYPTIDDFNTLRKSSERAGLMYGYRGFLGLFFNRTTFSGIFRSGPIGGVDQSGNYKVDCRYKANKLRDILVAIRDDFANRKVDVTKKDFRTVLRKYQYREDVLLYLDPPYMKQGYQLYNEFMEDSDYVEMAKILKKCKCKWVLSHDDYKPFLELFEGWTKIKSIEGVAYTINSIEGKRKTELIITNTDL
jgi:DNA adenine methylase